MQTKWIVYSAVFLIAAVAGLPEWARLARGESKPARDQRAPTLEELAASDAVPEMGEPAPRALSGPAAKLGGAPGAPGAPRQPAAPSPTAASATEADDAGAVSDSAPAGRGDESVARLASSLQRLDAIGTRSTLVDLERFATLWEDAQPSAAAESVVVTPKRSWAEVADQFPIRGILRDADDALALVGDRVVRVGDELLPAGELVLTAIEARGLRLAFRGEEVRLELPPFRSRASRPLGAATDGADGAEGFELEPPASDAEANAEPPQERPR